MLTARLESRREKSEYELDGLVLDVNSIEERARLVGKELNPGYAVKYKVADASNLAEATVVDVEWNVSKDGYLKPRVKIDPVELVGVTVTYATGFNAKFIKDNGIGPGAIIKITRSGDVIPFILETITPSNDVEMPDGNWTETGVDLIVKDVASNETVKYEQLLDFFTTIDVPALKEGNLQTLFEAGFTAPEDIITLTEAELCSLIGKAIGKKIFVGLREKLTDIPEYKLMGAHPAFGRGVGVRKMKKLWEAFQGDMALCKTPVNILQVEGFEHKTATKIANGYAKYQEFWNCVSMYITFSKYEQPKQGSFSGQTVVFTGFRSKEMEQQIEEQGGKIGSGVSSSTTLLVADDPSSTSGKAGKARQLGIKIISISELQAML
jgi:NAD-dependent DNA ligase